MSLASQVPSYFSNTRLLASSGGADTYGGGSSPGPVPGGWQPGITVGPPAIAGPDVGRIIGAPPPAGYNPAFGPPPQSTAVPGVTPSTASGTGVSTNSVTATSAHNMLKAMALELAFVVIATMIAGINDSWASSLLALMLALLVLRGLFQVDVFAAFASHTQLTPTQ